VTNGFVLSSECDFYATADAELVIYNIRDNHTVMLDGVLALLLQIIRNSDVDCLLSKPKLGKLLLRENVEFDDVSLNMWIGKLIDLQLVYSTE
jgi:hypothetical protein